MNKLFKLKYLIYLLIFINIILASRWVFDGNIFFHTDIARDFLLMQDIVDNKNLTLIGPRSGAIPGLFHGPLWLYLNVPAYILGLGDPAVVGWFWVILYIVSIIITYYVGEKIFGRKEGILSALLLSAVTILQVRSLFNPFGAMLLFPLFFYYFINYLQSKKLKILLLSIFTLGLIIQFQMAFGIPILILTCIYLIFYFYRNKKFSHIVSFFVLIIPLSSFLIFEARNQFLQIKSVTDYLFGTQTHGKLDLNLVDLIILRFKQSVADGIGTITQNNIYLTLFLLSFFLFTILKGYKEINQKGKLIYQLFSYFYFGFWVLTIFFKGPVWNYYYIPFIPLLILIFVSLNKTINRFIFYLIFISIYIVNLQTATADISTYNPNPEDQDISTWKFNKLIAQKVFEGEKEEFGYFIFTPDLYGYSPRFAMDFYQKKYKDRRVHPYQKKQITYLLIAPPPEYGKDPNSIWYQKNINSSSWKKNDIKIDKRGEEIITFANGFVIEKYKLSNEEINVKPNPYLIEGIFFR